MVVDAAADELLASEMMRSSELAGSAMVAGSATALAPRLAGSASVAGSATASSSSGLAGSANVADSATALAPNLRHVVRDKAHATRRLLSRPWYADAVLKEVCMRTFRGRGSLARMVQSSLEIRRLFVKYIKTNKQKLFKG